MTVDFDGDGTVDFGPTAPTSPFSNRYGSRELYFATIKLADSGGAEHVADVAVDVDDTASLDALLIQVWNCVKDGLRAQDLDSASTCLTYSSRDHYRELLLGLYDDLPQIDSTLTNITMKQLRDHDAEYEMRRMGADGLMHSFYIRFVRDVDGVWRLKTF
jgi:hypothetical protein